MSGWETGLLVASLVTSSASTVASGMQQSAAADYSAQVAEQQAEQARLMGEYNAAVVERQTAHDKRQAAEDYQREQARRRVGMASSGVDAGSGSALEVMSGMAAQNQANLLDIGYNGALQAQQARYGGQARQVSYQAQATQYGRSGASSSFNTVLGLTNTVVNKI